MISEAKAVELDPENNLKLVEICNIIECSKLSSEGLYPLKYHSLTQHMILDYISDIKK